MLPVDFVSGFWFFWDPTLFEIDGIEEICGRFGSFRWINVCISTLLGRKFDDVVSASLSCSAFCTFGTEARKTENNWLHFWFLAGSDRRLLGPPCSSDFVKATSDVQRFERQG